MDYGISDDSCGSFLFTDNFNSCVNYGGTGYRAIAGPCPALPLPAPVPVPVPVPSPVPGIVVNVFIS